MAAHLHLDATGGVAGDMFAAAMVDLQPSILDGAVELLRSAGLAHDVAIAVVDHHDSTFRGRRFVVDDPREKSPRKGPGTFVFRAGSTTHLHVPWQGIRAGIEGSALSPSAKARALDIFRRLAEAEGGVHGIAVDDVAFHEVGSQDSIADVVFAAIAIDRVAVAHSAHGALTSSTSSLPLGSGRVQTAHGELPVPAPATLALLQGLVVHDDGRPGERVTPTGAAIVRHLLGDVSAGQGRRRPGVVAGAGIGFGTKVFSGLSNILRVTLTVDSTPSEITNRPNWQEDQVIALETDIDDMTGEELATAMKRLVDVGGVRDVSLSPVIMKKGRPGSTLKVLCTPDAKDAVAAAVFAQTSTLGLRIQHFGRFVLSRSESNEAGLRVKRAQRPGGDSAKAEDDDASNHPALNTLAQRRAARQRAEASALSEAAGASSASHKDDDGGRDG